MNSKGVTGNILKRPVIMPFKKFLYILPTVVNLSANLGKPNYSLIPPILGSSFGNSHHLYKIDIIEKGRLFFLDYKLFNILNPGYN